MSPATVRPADVLVRWRLELLNGKCLGSREKNLRAMALADTLVGVYDFSALVSDDNKRKVVFVAEMWQDGKLLSQSVTPFVANKHLELRRPGLKVQSHVEGRTLCVDVTASSLARFVELSIDGTDAVFSENYFDVPAGTSVTVTTSLPDNWTADSKVQAHLRRHSS